MSQGSEKRAPPAAVRNAEPIIEVLSRVLSGRVDDGGLVLEVASGSGYHAAALAKGLPQFRWQPSDPSDEARRSIAAYVAEEKLQNLLPPLELDASTAAWPVMTADAMLCVNMIHISPWAATLGLFKGAGKLLKSGAPLVTYGPYSVDGDFIAESNIAFDQSLKTRNPDWGIRDVEDLKKVAEDNGFRHEEIIPMPANNHVLVFVKN